MVSMSSYRPSLYKLLSDNIQYDIHHYIEHAQNSNGPILELGAGTGRTIFPLAQLGLEIHAIDHDPEMISYVATKKDQRNLTNIFLTQTRMSIFELGQLFSIIQIPLRTIHLLNKTQRQECLNCCLKHLVPKGILLVHYSDLEKVPIDNQWKFVLEHKTTDDGYIWIEENIHSHGNSRILKHKIQQYNSNLLCVGNWMFRHQLDVFPETEFTNTNQFKIIKKHILSTTDKILVLEKQ